MPRRRRALSLIEILLAAVILGVMSIPLVGLFQMGNRMGVAGEREFLATLLASEVLELMRAEADERITDTDRYQPRPRVVIEAPEGFTYGVGTTRIEKGLDEVTVTIRWNEGKRARELEMKGVVSRRPAVNIVSTRGRRSSAAPAADPGSTPEGFTPPPKRRAGFQAPGAK